MDDLNKEKVSSRKNIREKSGLQKKENSICPIKKIRSIST